MANYTNVQILMDGPRNTVLKFTGTLDTSDVSGVLVDPATLLATDLINNVKAATFRVVSAKFSIEDGLELRLYWDATTPDLIESLTGRGKLDFYAFGGIQNPMSAGVTGKINYATQGWSAGANLGFTLELHLAKCQAKTQLAVTGSTVNGSILQQDTVDISATIPRP